MAQQKVLLLALESLKLSHNLDMQLAAPPVDTTHTTIGESVASHFTHLLPLLHLFHGQRCRAVVCGFREARSFPERSTGFIAAGQGKVFFIETAVWELKVAKTKVIATAIVVVGRNLSVIK